MLMMILENGHVQRLVMPHTENESQEKDRFFNTTLLRRRRPLHPEMRRWPGEQARIGTA
ncbi:hypothetical protein HYW94_03165 [Candidatus Uhrbacteria bacterium]|nr:hypothetical protein [Candidatus Uhrbacteria bacterium]